MTELEKVVTILETCIQDDCDNCPISLENKHCAPFVELPKITVMDALALLKGQEPITPCIRGEEGFSYNDLTRQYGCGSCGKPIDRGDEFCRHCGKKVKWDG